MTRATKHAFGQIASRYAPGDLQAVLRDPRFRALFPEAKAASGDAVDFGDGVLVPVSVLSGDGYLPSKRPSLQCAHCGTAATPGSNCRNCGSSATKP